MKRIILVFIITLCLFSTAHANEEYICTHGNSERLISVVYLSEQAKLPCEVQYTKNGETQILWNAMNQQGYCEEKAQAFVEKQRGWGWQCTLQDAEDLELSFLIDNLF